MWDDLIAAIEDKWDSDSEVEYAYARIGENLDDMECKCDYHTTLYIERSISGPDFDTIPRAQAKSMESEAKPRPPLKCTCGGIGACKDWCDLVTGEYSDGVY